MQDLEKGLIHDDDRRHELATGMAKVEVEEEQGERVTSADQPTSVQTTQDTALVSSRKRRRSGTSQDRASGARPVPDETCEGGNAKRDDDDGKNKGSTV